MSFASTDGRTDKNRRYECARIELYEHDKYRHYDTLIELSILCVTLL